MKSFLILLSCISFLISCSKKTVEQAATVTMSDVSFARQLGTSNCRFFVNLSTSLEKPASVSFSTIAGTATSNIDFIPQSGVLTFAVGQKQMYIDIPITGDSLRKNDQEFFVELTNPENCTLTNSKNKITIVNDGTYLPTDMGGYSTPLTYSGYTLIWSDEFNGNSLNTQNWNYETGGSGWGNRELENYTSRLQNAFVSNGNLVIEARKENYSGNEYTSARINTMSKKEFKFGRIDIRAKLPVAKGLWPALWMLGSDLSQAGWPACGETDIMELIGTYPNRVVGSFHWQKQDGSVGSLSSFKELTSEDFSQQFHVFSLVWKQDSLVILVDDQPYSVASSQTVINGNYPFNANSFFIFNVAVGGDWPGAPDNTTIFPQRMFVDYVRVFQ